MRLRIWNGCQLRSVAQFDADGTARWHSAGSSTADAYRSVDEPVVDLDPWAGLIVFGGPAQRERKVWAVAPTEDDNNLLPPFHRIGPTDHA